MPILMAASFDDQLFLDVGTTVGTEARAFSNGGNAAFDYYV